MKGYLGNTSATEETVKDGWLHSGDIAYYDEEGRFYIVDRLKELIKVKGYQVAPAELEDLLRKHPKVLDVGVVGVEDARKGKGTHQLNFPICKSKILFFFLNRYM